MIRTAHAIWFTAPGRAELWAEPIAAPGPGEALVRTHYSVPSRGTERLVISGNVPASEHERMRCPAQVGDFSFPVKYGYAVVGLVEDGPAELVGKTVFALHPHQDLFVSRADALSVVPDGVAPHRAVLAANMETALNALWDSGAGPADRIVVVGGGTIGVLIAHLAARLPGTEVTLVDIRPERAVLAERLGLAFALPEAAPHEADIVFHASATAEGLSTAIAACGTEATLVEASWYGDATVNVPLGAAFHARRLRIVSTQVGMVAPSRRPRWNRARRMQAALALLGDPALDLLLGERIAFEGLAEAMPRILATDASGLPPLVAYPPAMENAECTPLKFATGS